MTDTNRHLLQRIMALLGALGAIVGAANFAQISLLDRWPSAVLLPTSNVLLGFGFLSTRVLGRMGIVLGVLWLSLGIDDWLAHFGVPTYLAGVTVFGQNVYLAGSIQYAAMALTPVWAFRLKRHWTQQRSIGVGPLFSPVTGWVLILVTTVWVGNFFLLDLGMRFPGGNCLEEDGSPGFHSVVVSIRGCGWRRTPVSWSGS